MKIITLKSVCQSVCTRITGNYRTEYLNFSQIFLLLLAFFFCVFSKLPLTISSAGSSEQWRNLMPVFFSEQQDFLFSYGPLYWLTGNTVAHYSKLAFLISAIFISVYSALYWTLLARIAQRRNAIFLLVVILIVFAKEYSSSIYLTLPFFIILYFKEVGDERWMHSKSTLIFIASLVTFFLYLRFFYGMIAILTFGSYIFSKEVLRLRFKSIIIFSSAVFIFYFAYGFLIFNQTENIINYLNINLQLNFGNSVDMIYDKKLNNATYIYILLTFVIFNFFLIKASPSLILTTNGLMLIFMKIGFSRADHYIGYFVIPVALMSLLFITTDNRRWIVLSITILIMMYAFGKFSIYSGAPKLTTLKVSEDFSRSYSDRAAETYSSYKLPSDIISKIGSQTIDIYPNNNEYLLANKLNYQHRPLFQNFMTLTPGLDSLNAKFLTSKDAPAYILWAGTGNEKVFDDFDGKYTLNEDPLTTTSILSHYRLVSEFTDMHNRPMILMKMASPTESTSPQELGSFTAKLGEWIKVPKISSHAVIKLKPKLNLTLLAKIQNALYRGEILYVNYKLANGDIKRYRQNIINSQSGIWASPWVNEFPLKGEKVIELMLETSSRHYFEDNFSASWQVYPFDGEIIDTPLRLSSTEETAAEVRVE